MIISFVLCAIGGLLIGLACASGGALMLLAFPGFIAFVFAYLTNPKNPNEAPLPIIQKAKSGSITAVGKIVHTQETGKQPALNKSYLADVSGNEPLTQFKTEQVWKRTEAELSEYLRNELNTLVRLIPKVHTAAFFMFYPQDSVFILRTAAGIGTEKIAKNAQFGKSGAFSRLFDPNVERVLEGDLFLANNPIYKEKVAIRSMLAVPVYNSNKKRHGVLLLDSLEQNAFHAGLAETLAFSAKTINAIASKTLTSAKNYIMQEQFSVLYNYQKKFFQTMTVQDIYTRVAEYIKENIQYDRMMLFALDPHDETKGKVVYCDGVDAEYFFKQEFQISEKQVDKGLIILAISKNKPLERNFEPSEYINRIRDDERRNTDLRYMFLLPTSLSETSKSAMFTIDLEKFSKEHYSDHEKSLLKAIAGTAGYALERALQFEKGKDLAMKDGLTGLVNHRTMHEKLRTEKLRADRQKINIGLLMMDIDHFKRVNDTYGHAAGDEIIKGIARTICNEVRAEIDLVARYGGEEFVVALVDTTPEGIKDTAERIRKAVEKSPFDIKQKDPLHVTVSIGAYLVSPDSRIDMEESLKLADKALYKAKNNGRNQVIEYRSELDAITENQESAV